MQNSLKHLLPQWVINYFYHLPKAVLANILYGLPSRNLKVIGVTGTDGKTTVVNMIYKILKDSSKKVSMVSTINAVIAGKTYETGFHVTSPDPFMVQRFLRKALGSGDEYMILEVTSHGLDQFRFWGVKFEVGVITNITHEHLDYHKTFENYFKTKIKLIKNARFAIVNHAVIHFIPRPWGKVFNRSLVTFGLRGGDFNQKVCNFKLKIPGDYNIENTLAAIAATSVLGVGQAAAQRSLENFKSLAGRMEEIKNDRWLRIIIDFAHTPNGLESALKALRSRPSALRSSTVSAVEPLRLEKATPWRPGRIISIIGCEGFRDVSKRAMMGEIAQQQSDIVIVTSLDPRGQLEVINKQISEGANKAGAKKEVNFFVINDRKEAISFAINSLAKKGDTVGIFGKGHEASLNLDGKEEIPWSDIGCVKEVLRDG